MILQYLKESAEAYLGEKVTDAVITVPAYFNDSQRQATKDAGKIAGLNVKRIINEPTAASLAYGLDKKKEETIAVYDLGGGTFDISILDIGEGVFEVKATNGDTHLGGDDFDQRVIQYLAAEFKKEQGIDLSDRSDRPPEAQGGGGKGEVRALDAYADGHQPPVHHGGRGGSEAHERRRSRARSSSSSSRISSSDRSDRAGRRSRTRVSRPADIDEVILVGGSTRIPMVQQKVKELFGKEPHKGINPDEVVAVGAAIQAGVLGGDVNDVLLLDVTPLSLGIETLGGVLTRLIPRNTTIPTRKSEIFSTAADAQTAVDIHVLQGEREMAIDNKTIGRFQLSGIPPAPRGIPQIEVTFDIDADGILHVTAKDKGTGKEQKIVIKASSGLSEGEIDRMVKDADRLKDEDRKKRALVDAKNEADSLDLPDGEESEGVQGPARRRGREEDSRAGSRSIKSGAEDRGHADDQERHGAAQQRLAGCGSTDVPDGVGRQQARQSGGGGAAAPPRPSSKEPAGPPGERLEGRRCRLRDPRRRQEVAFAGARRAMERRRRGEAALSPRRVLLCLTLGAPKSLFLIDPQSVNRTWAISSAG